MCNKLLFFDKTVWKMSRQQTEKVWDKTFSSL